MRRPRRNPTPREAAEALYPKVLSVLRGTEATKAQRTHALVLAQNLLGQFPELGAIYGLPGDKLAISGESRVPARVWAPEKPKKRKARPPPKPKWARRRPAGWTLEDEQRRAAAWREAEATKLRAKQTLGRKHVTLDRAPSDTVAATKDGLLIWCGEGAAMLYVLGKPRRLKRTCAEVEAEAEKWLAEKRRRGKYALYYAEGAVAAVRR